MQSRGRGGSSAGPRHRSAERTHASGATPVVTVRQAVALALSLPETTEHDHHGRIAFWVGGKIFATVWDERHLNVMLDSDSIERAVRTHPAMCGEFWWGKRLRAVHVDLTTVSRSVLAGMLTEAWSRKAPRRLPNGPE